MVDVILKSTFGETSVNLSINGTVYSLTKILVIAKTSVSGY
jgi:hypothetical protein